MNVKALFKVSTPTAAPLAAAPNKECLAAVAVAATPEVLIPPAADVLDSPNAVCALPTPLIFVMVSSHFMSFNVFLTEEKLLNNIGTVIERCKIACPVFSIKVRLSSAIKDPKD